MTGHHFKGKFNFTVKDLVLNITQKIKINQCFEKNHSYFDRNVTDSLFLKDQIY